MQSIPVVPQWRVSDIEILHGRRHTTSKTLVPMRKHIPLVSWRVDEIRCVKQIQYGILEFEFRLLRVMRQLMASVTRNSPKFGTVRFLRPPSSQQLAVGRECLPGFCPYHNSTLWSYAWSVGHWFRSNQPHCSYHEWQKTKNQPRHSSCILNR